MPDPTDPGPTQPPPPVASHVRAHHDLAGRDLGTVAFRLDGNLPGYPGVYYAAATVASGPVTVVTEASGSLDELEAFHRRHLDLIHAERARQAGGGGP